MSKIIITFFRPIKKWTKFVTQGPKEYATHICKRLSAHQTISANKIMVAIKASSINLKEKSGENLEKYWEYIKLL